MTTSTIEHADTRGALLWGAALAIIWVAVALLRPGTTFHLAPFLVAATPTVLFSLGSDSARDRRRLPALGAIGVAMAVATAMLLSAVGAMEGPVFEPFSTPMVEVLVFTAVGAVAGIGFGWVRLSR